jgi:Fe-Mn family superoxide dismutase
VNRREHLKLMLGVAAGALTGGVACAEAAQQAAPAPAAPPAGPFKLPPLGYAYDALEPHIDAATMKIHHSAHHQTYVNNANAAAAKLPAITEQPPEIVLAGISTLPADMQTPVRNNLGGHWNHTFFWDLMTPGGAKEPGGKLAEAIKATFGDLAQLVEKVNGAGATRFGSGWAWLVVTKDGKLEVASTPNQDTPHMLGHRGAVLGVDVWEHAYYLKYQNKRADYLKAWWNVVNWDKAGANFAKLMG